MQPAGKLPQILPFDPRRNQQPMNQQQRLRRAIRRRSEWINPSLPLPELTLQHLIDLSAHDLAVLSRKKALCDMLQRETQKDQLPSGIKKVIVVQKRALKAKENEVEDLKTCKSLLNVKVKAQKKVLPYFTSKGKQNNRYIADRMRSYCSPTGQPHTDPLKQMQNDDFQLQPWSGQDYDRERQYYRA